MTIYVDGTEATSRPLSGLLRGSMWHITTSGEYKTHTDRRTVLKLIDPYMEYHLNCKISLHYKGNGDDHVQVS